MKSVLIICKYFIPYAPTAGAVIRVITLAEFLHQHGWKVFVLASRGDHFGDYGYGQVTEIAHVRYLRDWLTPKLQSARRRYAQAQRKRSLPFLRLAKAVLRSMINNIFVPDPGILMVPKYAALASSMIREHDIRNVLVSSPPHSTQLVGYTLKKRFGDRINLIVDYRDSWNNTPLFRKSFFLADRASRRLERAVLRISDRFTYVSQPILDKIRSEYGNDLPPAPTLVMNGFRSGGSPPPPRPTTNGPVKIGYFGSISDRPSSFRNISHLLRILDGAPALRDLLQFEFYGELSLEQHDLVDYPQLKVHGWLSHADALRRMAEMDFLMMLHCDPASADEVVTGKLFDYIAARRPILCFSPQNMEARRLIERHGIGITADIGDVEGIRQQLEALPALRGKDFYESMDLSQFSRTRQYEKILDLLV